MDAQLDADLAATLDAVDIATEGVEAVLLEADVLQLGQVGVSKALFGELAPHNALYSSDQSAGVVISIGSLVGGPDQCKTE